MHPKVRLHQGSHPLDEAIRFEDATVRETSQRAQRHRLATDRLRHPGGYHCLHGTAGGELLFRSPSGAW